MELSYTLIFVVLTVITSLLAFNNSNIVNKFIMYPFAMKDDPKEYYRLISHGLIHADFGHLFFNMFALYSFGSYVEAVFAMMGKPVLYPCLYIFGIIAASLPDMVKHKNHSYYRSLGASGGVSAVLFSCVYFAPWTGIRIYFIPINIPAIIFAVLYLAYSVYMSRKGTDNVGHDAHFWGSVFGFVFTFLFDPTHGRFFLEQITHPQF
jgi:membrane associated rhomboid family serine protease